MASDAHPRELGNIKKSLTTRFMSGLVVEIAPPSRATRVKILEEKLQSVGIQLSPELIRLVARRVAGSMRDLEGACNLLRAYHGLVGSRLDRLAVEEILRALADSRAYLSLEVILREVAAGFDIEEKEILGNGRRRELAKARHLFMHLARELAAASYSAIGAFVGGRSHTTVMFACRKMQGALARDESLAAIERAIRASLTRPKRS